MTISDTKWQSQSEFFSQPLPPHLDAWLQHPRLSQSLKSHFPDHEIKLISQNFTKLSDTEAAILNLKPQTNSWQREIAHIGNNNMHLVYARTIVPEKTYQRFANEFNALGNQSIGETLLFKDPNILRSEFRFSTISASHPLYPRISEILGSSQHYYARFSIFHSQDFPLLITEIYTPEQKRWERT